MSFINLGTRDYTYWRYLIFHRGWWSGPFSCEHPPYLIHFPAVSQYYFFIWIFLYIQNISWPITYLFEYSRVFIILMKSCFEILIYSGLSSWIFQCFRGKLFKNFVINIFIIVPYILESYKRLKDPHHSMTAYISASTILKFLIFTIRNISKSNGAHECFWWLFLIFLWLFVSTLTFNFFNKQFQSSTLTTIHVSTCIVPYFVANNVIFLSPLIVDLLFLSTIIHVLWFQGWPYHLTIH